MISPDKTASIFSIHIKKQKKSKLYTKFASELSLFNNEKKNTFRNPNQKNNQTLNCSSIFHNNNNRKNH